MPDFAVSTKFLSKDEVTRAIKRMDRQAGKFGKNASAAFKNASRQGSRFGGIVKGILTAGIISRGIGLLARGLREVTTEFISFDDAIKASTARFNDLKVNTKAGQQAILELEKTARRVGARTEFTATQAAQGLEFLALAGFNAKQSIAALPATVNFATAANVELARAVDIGTDAVGAFGLMTKDSVQLQKNFIRTNDLLAATVASSNTNIEQLFDSVVAGAPTFIKTGQSIETFNALVGKMASQGFKGEKSGTALRNVMLRLAAPTKEAQGVLNGLGITIADQKGDFRDIIDIIGDFEKNLKGLGNVQRAAALDTIFGKKAITGFNILLEEGSKSLRNYRDDLIASGGASARMADIMRQSLGKRLAALKSAAIEVGFKFLEAFKKQGVGSIDALTKALRIFNVQPVIDKIKGAIDIFKDFFKVISPITDVISKLNKSEVKGILAIAGAIKAVALATALWNVALATNPFVLAGFGIAGLFGGAAIIEKRFKLFKKIFDLFDVGKGKGISDRHLLALGGRPGRGSAFRTSLPPEGEAARSHISPPNRQDLIRSRQDVNLSGRIDLAGAPEGSTFELFQAPRVDTAVLGANP